MFPKSVKKGEIRNEGFSMFTFPFYTIRVEFTHHHCVTSLIESLYWKICYGEGCTRSLQSGKIVPDFFS